MGIEVNYRTSIVKKEIIDALIEIQIESAPVFIWQNVEGKRNVAKVKIEALDFNSDSIFLVPYSEEDVIPFNKFKISSTFYIRGNTKNIVFKQEKSAKKTVRGYLQIFIPREVKMFEKRSEPRQNFEGQNPKVTAEIYPGGRIDISTKTIFVDVTDVSISAMGFLLEKKHARLFFEKDKIKVVRVGKYNFPRAIHGEIVHTGPSQNHMDLIRIGIRFTDKLTSQIIESI